MALRQITIEEAALVRQLAKRLEVLLDSDLGRWREDFTREYEGALDALIAIARPHLVSNVRVIPATSLSNTLATFADALADLGRPE